MKLPRLPLILTVALLGACTEPTPPNVTETNSLGTQYDCASSDCLSAYRDFPKENETHSRPLRSMPIETLMERLQSLPPAPPSRLGSRTLRAALIEALNIGFLLDGLETRPLKTVLISDEAKDGYREKNLLFSDPFVGTIEVLLLEPDTHRGASVIGLHGHRDDNRAFADDYLGRMLARAGYRVIIPTFRAFACEKDEYEISLSLMENGFTLMGLRVYETLLMAKYLRFLGDSGSLALITHSGGSSAGVITARLSAHIKAFTGDTRTDFRNLCGSRGIHCQTTPSLFPLARAFHDYSTLGIPALYGVPLNRNKDAFLGFLNASL